MAKALELTGEERILLYMLNFRDLGDGYDCEAGVTQKGIAVNTRIQRKHISRHLNKLRDGGFLEEQARRVRGAKQKMLCYGLTPQGHRRARELEERIGSIIVSICMGGDAREMRIADIDGATSVHLRLSDIAFEALEKDVLDMGELECLEENNRRLMDERSMRAEVYRKALAAAWRSGILTSSEKHLIDALREHLGISPDDHAALESAAMNGTPEPMALRDDLQDEILNLLAGQPPEVAEEVLAMLRERFGRK